MIQLVLILGEDGERLGWHRLAACPRVGEIVNLGFTRAEVTRQPEHYSAVGLCEPKTVLHVRRIGEGGPSPA